MKRNTQQLKDFIQVRRDILRMVHNVNSGHPGGSLGCTEFMVALYQNLMDRKEGFDMDGRSFLPFKRTYFTCFFSVLARSGYFPVSELATFRLIMQDCKDTPPRRFTRN
jgi:transketolase